MSRLNAAALGAALLIGMAGAAEAQTQGGQAPGVRAPGEKAPHGRGHGGVRGPGRQGRRGSDREFARELNLTDAQRTQIRAIHEKYQPRIEAVAKQFKTRSEAVRALRQKGDTAGARAASQRLRTEMQQRIQPIREQEKAEIRTLLTPEQRAKFDAAKERRKDRMENRGKDGRRDKAGRNRPTQRS